MIEAIQVHLNRNTPVIDYLEAVFADDRYFMTTAQEADEWQTPEKKRSLIAENLKDPNA